MTSDPITLRGLRADDRPNIARVLESCDAFRPEEVAIGLELLDESLNPGPSTDYAWTLAELGGKVVGFACFGPVPLTEGTFDLYWIAVAPEGRGRGVASALDEAVEGAVRARGARWLLAETSSTAAYAPARAFYLRRGYRPLGQVPDFYRPGDDRLTFGKRLGPG